MDQMLEAVASGLINADLAPLGERLEPSDETALALLASSTIRFRGDALLELRLADRTIMEFKVSP
ncbi:hypothetical protein [Actibacterium sp. 188UL27-1]|uniref:hypothetical protein n=1 Tax=Actibacterium sp. 188UL27-1 TaxID=2786961 RepID=UPI00195D6400|nr:hypothetical protein [Actibacterium sp. 188UL27-1]MBM7070127.1 hypothetical protein [Actibacterium sp. 188UL27-1]